MQNYKNEKDGIQILPEYHTYNKLIQIPTKQLQIQPNKKQQHATRKAQKIIQKVYKSMSLNVRNRAKVSRNE